METEDVSQRLVRELGGSTVVARRLAQMGLSVTRQCVSRWGRQCQIGPDMRLPMIILCQESGLDWHAHDDLRRAFGLAMKAVGNARKIAA